MDGLERTLLALICVAWVLVVVALLARWPGAILWSVSTFALFLAGRLFVRWVTERRGYFALVVFNVGLVLALTFLLSLPAIAFLAVLMGWGLLWSYELWM